MHVPLTVNDFIERAELVYGDRIGIVDEPEQPAESLGSGSRAIVAPTTRVGSALIISWRSIVGHSQARRPIPWPTA